MMHINHLSYNEATYVSMLLRTFPCLCRGGGGGGGGGGRAKYKKYIRAREN